MISDEFFFTSDVLKSHPEAKDSTIRSLVRRKFVCPVKRGSLFVWSREQMDTVRAYFEHRSAAQ